MRFLVDECTGPAVSRWLRTQQHEVFSVYEQARGLSDNDIIQKAFAEDWILITNDKDFGEKVFRERRPHHGVIFLRLADERASSKIDTLRRLLQEYGDQLADRFVVVTEQQVRFAQGQR
jgi:predicted nuclease of predicted toxin-antitoxin system